MNHSKVFILVCTLLSILSLPLISFAQERKDNTYIVIKPGVFIPSGDLNDKGFDNGFMGELAIGSYYTPNIALEAGVSYYQTKASKADSVVVEDDKIWVVPVTITFKGVLPLKGVELTGGAGVGVYFATLDVSGTSTLTGGFSSTGHGTALGGHAVAGLNVDISPKMFIGVEGKYIFTTGADLLDAKVKLNGFAATGVLGYRF